MEDNLPEQRVNKLDIACLEVKDNSEQNRGGKHISILCKSTGETPYTEIGSSIMLPSGKRFSLRNCEKTSNGDYIVTIKGLHRRDIKRGHLIVPTSYAVESGQDAFILIPSGKETLEKGNYYIQGGIHKEYNSRNSRPSASITFHGRIGVVRFFWPFPLATGAKYLISNERNRDLQTPATLVFPGSLGQRESTDLSARILKFGGRPSLKALYSIILRIKHFVELPDYMTEEEFEGSIKCGSYSIMSREYDRIRGAVLKRTSAVGGIPENKIIEQIKGDNNLLKVIIRALIEEKLVKNVDTYLLNVSNDMKNSLSPIAKKLLIDLEDENEGITLSNISNPLFSETYKALGRMDLIHILSGEIIISNEKFIQLKEDILKNLSKGEKFMFNEIKESLNLSRRILIPLLEEMDAEGYFERDGEVRFVLKTK